MLYWVPSSGTQYKIRFFAKLSGGNIVPHPEVILPREGESASGHAGDVLYVSPKMYDNSYIHTFKSEVCGVR